MMNLIISFFCSIAGSLTPGTINLSVLQSGLDGQVRMGRRMALAAGIMEYIYAWIAIHFESWISESIGVFSWFKLLAATVLIVLGLTSLQSKTAIEKSREPRGGGFRKGLLLGLLNPLAMPFWLGIIAYLKSVGWIQLDTWVQIHLFLAGVSLGVMTLLLLVVQSAQGIQQRGWVRSERVANIPAYLMLFLGAIGFVLFFL